MKERNKILLVAPEMPPVTGERICARNLEERMRMSGVVVKRAPNNLPYHTRARRCWLFLGAGEFGFWRDCMRLGICRMLNQVCLVSVHNSAWRRLIRSRWVQALIGDVTFLVLSDRVAVALREAGYTVQQFDNYVDDLGRIARKPDVRRLVWLSAVTREKGFLTAYSVFHSLRSGSEKWRFDVYGPLHAPLRADEFPNAVFHGPMPHERIREVFKDGGILILPSEYGNENQPLVILEGFSAGVPVLVSAVGGLPEMVESSIGPCGVSIRSGVIEDYVAGANEITLNYSAYSNAARRKFEECYSEESFDRRLSAVLLDAFEVKG